MLRLPLLLLTAGLLCGAELPTGLFQAQPPTGEPLGVTAARLAPEPGREILLHGVVGGRPKPFVEGRALFTVMDAGLVCATSCGTGWSGCGHPPEELRKAVATIQVADDAGRPLAAALANVGGLIPGAAVVVRGTVAPGSNDKMLVVNATAIHVRSAAPSPKAGGQ